MEKRTTKSNDGFSELIESYRPLKIAVYVAGGLVGLFILGRSFKIIAHTIRGYKEMSAAIHQ